MAAFNVVLACAVLLALCTFTLAGRKRSPAKFGVGNFLISFLLFTIRPFSLVLRVSESHFFHVPINPYPPCKPEGFEDGRCVWPSQVESSTCLSDGREAIPLANYSKCQRGLICCARKEYIPPPRNFTGAPTFSDPFTDPALKNDPIVIQMRDVHNATFKIPIYGRYCGPRKSGPGAPIDAVDAACYRHDYCYQELGYFDCRCDRTLVRELRDLLITEAEYLSKKGKFFGGGIRKFYMNAPCYRRDKPPKADNEIAKPKPIPPPKFHKRM